MTRPALVPLQLALLALAAVGLSVVGLACGDGDSQPASPTPTASATSPTPAEASQTATSAPSPTATASDEAVIRPALEAIRANDSGRLKALIAYTRVPCAVQPPQGIPQPPRCPAGVSDQTPVDVFPAVSCEGFYVLPADIDAFLEAKGGSVYGAYRLPAPGGIEGFPPSMYGVIVSYPLGPAAGLFGLDTGGRIVTWSSGCGTNAEQLAKQSPAGSTWLIAPDASASDAEAVIWPTLDAIRANDPTRLKALVRYTQVPCMGEPAGGFPQPRQCPTATPDGTAIDVFPVSSGEGHYLLASEMDEFFGYGRGGAIYGVYRSPAPGGMTSLPQAIYGVIVYDPSKQEAERASIFGLDADGKIVHWQVGLGATPEELAQQRPAGSTWVIVPAN